MRQDANGSYVVSAVAPENGICPHCGSPSRHRHGRYSRRLKDLPVQGKLVTVEILLSRWKCRSLNCSRKTFADRVPRVAQPYARSTSRLSEIIELIGHSMGGRPGEYVLHRLGIQVSDDTILRHLKRNSANPAPRADIRVVGIDDWSWRRSSRYGTIMVDLERHEVVDVLNDRKAETAAKWLKNRPSLEVVSRDRCGLYAQAAREGAPQAKEVADRFHLVQNLRAAIKEQMSLLGQGNIRPILSKEALACNAVQHRRARLVHRASRQETVEMLHALRQQGHSFSEIARQTGYERRSIAKWLKFSNAQDRQRAPLTPSSPRYFEAFLADCWRDGNRLGRHLFHDVKNRGYTGSRSHLERFLGVWRAAEKMGPDHPHPEDVVPQPVRDPTNG
ncbi:ISL3 family transposase, partial [Roseobacter sp.]|uniref:ISL3 family transposase n=1 Tax=Roseobacter sp. TaxID=1907202 RepID=UPI003859C14C